MFTSLQNPDNITAEYDEPYDHKVDALFAAIDKNDLKDVNYWLDSGAKATKCTPFGRNAIGFAVHNNQPEILKVLLKSCKKRVDASLPPGNNNTTHILNSSKLYNDQLCYYGRRMDTQFSANFAKLLMNEYSSEKYPNNFAEALQWKRKKKEDANDDADNKSNDADYNDDDDDDNDIDFALGISSENLGNNDEKQNIVDVCCTTDNANVKKHNDNFKKHAEIFQNTMEFKEAHVLDRYGNSPIHYAALFGYYECARILLKYYAPVNKLNNMELTPLHLATPHPKIVSLLLKYNANVVHVSCINSETALHVAARIGNFATMKLLCKAGVDVNHCNFRFRTAIFYAIIDNRYEMVKHLLSNGADVNMFSYHNYVTPLSAAVYLQYNEMVSLLLSYDAQTITEQYLIHTSIIKNNLDLAKLLIRHFGVKHTNIFDQNNCTPLWYAIKLANCEIIEVLLLNGAEPIQQTWNSTFNGMEVAIKYFRDSKLFRKIICILSLHVVTANDFNAALWSPIYPCHFFHYFDIAEVILKEGVLWHIQELDINTYTSEANVTNFMKLLVNMGLKLPDDSPQYIMERYRNNFDGARNFVKLKNMFTNEPLSLKALSRIAVRNDLIGKMHSMHLDRKSPTYELIKNSFECSILRYLISQTEMPKTLQDYVYHFTDIPSIISNEVLRLDLSNYCDRTKYLLMLINAKFVNRFKSINNIMNIPIYLR